MTSMSTRPIRPVNKRSTIGRAGERPLDRYDIPLKRERNHAWIVPLAVIAISAAFVVLFVTAYDFVQPILNIINTD
jgi:hypothetical protein